MRRQVDVYLSNPCYDTGFCGKDYFRVVSVIADITMTTEQDIIAYSVPDIYTSNQGIVCKYLEDITGFEWKYDSDEDIYVSIY